MTKKQKRPRRKKHDDYQSIINHAPSNTPNTKVFPYLIDQADYDLTSFNPTELNYISLNEFQKFVNVLRSVKNFDIRKVYKYQANMWL